MRVYGVGCPKGSQKGESRQKSGFCFRAWELGTGPGVGGDFSEPWNAAVSNHVCAAIWEGCEAM